MTLEVSLIRQSHPLEGPDQQGHHVGQSLVLVLSPAKVKPSWTTPTSWSHNLLKHKHYLISTLLAGRTDPFHFPVSVSFQSTLSHMLDIIMGC